MRVWLDDERPMPDGFDTHVKTAAEAVLLLQTGDVTFLSFDHDLGNPDNGTGYQVASWVEKNAFEGRLPRFEWAVHSANPVGARSMTAALRNADAYWAR